MSKAALYFTRFKTDVGGIHLPEKFTYPFYYEPHVLSRIAADELQDYLTQQTDWEHNFGLQENSSGLVIGKMFGVLVVKNEAGELGYLAAFSGKLAGSNVHERFVPPVFDMLKEDSFFLQKERIINQYNQKIKELEEDNSLRQSVILLQNLQDEAEMAISKKKQALNQAKKERKAQRIAAQNTLKAEDRAELEADLVKQSLRDKHELKLLTIHWNEKTEAISNYIQQFTCQISELKQERKNKSASLQDELFRQYTFLNTFGEERNLLQIFYEGLQQKPPSAAGECAAPKLLQYAFLHGFKPIAMAEFWWGQSPKSEVRKHKNFYPACTGKCKPILEHMLKGIDVEPNPMLTNPKADIKLDIIYEDEWIAVVNKPEEFLSVPGIHISDSVYQRMKQRYPNASGPLIVHRLDMSTSGILLIAKDKDSHKFIQNQFIKKTITKRYIALLNGILEKDGGEINLPLRVDLDDRPRQLVCYEHGKAARTIWKVIDRKNNKTRVYFYPVTGRTHQLRVHAAHPLGLNMPIVGDDLYGKKENRLHLHAERISFIHPHTKQKVEFVAECGF